MSSVNSTIVSTALPAIQRSLGASLNWTSWVLTVYQLTIITVMPLMGRFSDEMGRKRIFIVCVAAFLLGSLFCALSSNINWLIISRVLQAVGGGSFMPLAMGIVGDHFPENKAQAIGLLSSIFPLGGIVGPGLGGWLLAVTTWRAIFLINVPICILILVLASIILESDPTAERKAIDLVGAVFFASFVLSFMIFMARWGEKPAAASSPVSWILLFLSIFGLMAFIRWETTTANPIIEISLLKSPAFAISNGLNLLYGACTFGLLAFIPYYGQLVYGLSDFAGGTLLIARGLGMMGMAIVTSMLLNRTGYRLPMCVGFSILALSTLCMSYSLHNPAILGITVPSLWWLAALVFASGIGVGFATPSSNNAAIELMPQKIAAISGLRGMFRQTGGVIGTSVIVLMLSVAPDKLIGFHMIFLGMTLLLLLAVPLILKVPDGR
jgi:Arabinose efflux permease